MEKLPQIIDSVKMMAEGGISTSESKFSLTYLQQVVHETRATVIKQMFIKERRVQAVWSQVFIPDFDPKIQDDPACVKFQIPPFVSLDNKNDGMFYVGEVGGTCAYRKVNSRAEMANFNMHKGTRNTDIILGGNIRVLFSDGVLEIYNNKNLKEIRIDGIFLNPTQVPTYNYNEDVYPLDDSSLAQMKQLILQGVTGREALSVDDTVQDNKDDFSKAQTRRTQ